MAITAILKGDPKYSHHNWLNGHYYRRIDATHDYPAAQLKNLSTYYEERDHIQPQEVLTVEFGRGCIFNCHFCTLTHRGIKEDHSRSEDNLYDELLTNYEKWGVTNYSIADETVNDYTEKLYRYANQIKKLPFKPNMAGYIRGDLLVSKPDDWRMIHDLGLNSQFYGIESFHRPSGRSVGKGMETVRLQDGLLDYKWWSEQQGFFQGHINLIAGLPHETLDTLRATKKWITENWVGQSSLINPLWIPSNPRPYEEQSRFSLDPAKYGFAETTIGNRPWIAGPQKRYGKMYEALKKRESGFSENVYNTEESTFNEEVSFMNWKSDTLDLYEVINFLEHEWYTDGIDQPPLPFGYHNWLIDPKYKWEDMSAPQSTMEPPAEYAKKFIDNYKQKKLAF
jgi:radical SAM superfamily enzyme YgiQ (UPF0313 family)